MPIYNFALTHKGIAHIEKELPNQDSAGCFCINDNSDSEISINIVADGVSACKYAAETSEFLKNTAISAFKNRYEDNDNKTFDMSAFKECVEEIFERFNDMIKKNNCDYLDYGSTLEIVAIHGNNAYVLHAGDGLIVVVQQDGNIVLSNNKGHSGEYASQVFPFFVKSKWEFAEYKDVAAVLVASDGVYDEIVPPLARRMLSGYDMSLLIPCIDIRTHKGKRSHIRFLDRYIMGKLSDDIMYHKCAGLYHKRIITCKDKNILKEHFYKNVPYRKNVRSRDDLSVVVWGNTELLPDCYDISDHLPNYLEQWKLERRLDIERAMFQQGVV